MKRYFFITVFIITSKLIFGQNNGLILDSNNNPLEGVEIVILDKDIFLKSNLKGEFPIYDDIKEHTKIYFYKSGYETKILTYKKQKLFQIYLESLHVNVDEVQISNINYKLSSSQTQNIEVRPISPLILSTNNLADYLTDISGVDMINSGSGIQKIVVRGLSGMRIVTYLNGVRINNQQWGGDHGMGFTDLGLYKVELMKGPASIRFGGDALGGVLYFSDNQFYQNQKTISGNISSKYESSHHLFSNQYGLKFSKNKFFFNTYGLYTIASDYRIPNNRYVYNSRFYNKALKFSTAYKGSKWNTMLLYQYDHQTIGIPAHSHSLNPNINDLLASNQESNVTRPNQFHSNHLLLSRTNIFLDKGKLTLAFSQYQNHLQEYEAWTIPEFDMILSTTQASLNLYRPVHKIKLDIGTQLSLQDNVNYKGRDTLLPNSTTKDIGLYSIIEYSDGSFGSSLGFRYDIRDIKSTDLERQFKIFSYSLGVRGMIKKHDLRISYSNGFRSPYFSELLSDGVHHGTIRYELGDDKLGVEQSHQIDFKHEWSNEHIGFILNPFISQINNFISLEPTNDTIENYRVYKYQKIDKVYLKGMELNLHYHPHIIHNLHLDQSWSFIEAYDKESKYLPLIPANKILSTATYYFNKNFLWLDNLSLKHKYVLQKKDISINEMESQSYHLIDVQSHFKFLDNFNLMLRINNLLNKRYIPHLSRLKPFDIPHPSRSFNISITYEF